MMVLFLAATKGEDGAGPLGAGGPTSRTLPVPAFRVWWGLEHLWWRVWSVASRGLALPHTHSRLSQGAVDDADDGLQAAALQQRAVVALDDVHRNLPVAHLQMWTSHCDATSQCASADASASPASLT